MEKLFSGCYSYFQTNNAYFHTIGRLNDNGSHALMYAALKGDAMDVKMLIPIYKEGNQIVNTKIRNVTKKLHFANYTNIY